MVDSARAGYLSYIRAFPDRRIKELFGNGDLLVRVDEGVHTPATSSDVFSGRPNLQ
jgi:hypothetical protein